MPDLCFRDAVRAQSDKSDGSAIRPYRCTVGAHRQNQRDSASWSHGEVDGLAGTQSARVAARETAEGSPQGATLGRAQVNAAGAEKVPDLFFGSRTLFLCLPKKRC